MPLDGTTNSILTSLTLEFFHFFHFAAGFAGDDAPQSVFPSLLGRARQPGIMVRGFDLDEPSQ